MFMKVMTREERMSAIQEKLEQGVHDIFESEKYKNYISTMSKFPSYSINNCILIASQCLHATQVCGYKAWQNLFGRTVNKGEQGIMILAPVKFKASVDEPLYDENHHPVFNEDGTQKMESVEKEIQSFRPVYVFDVSQTSGKPLPTLATLLDSTVDKYEQLKSILMEVSPVPVEFKAIEGGANGYYSPGGKKIVVKEDLPELQTIKTLIHEIAHASLGHGGKEDKWDRETHEVQAESVAYWVSQMLELDTAEYSFGYISGWSKTKEVPELKEHLELIKQTADTLSCAIEKKIKELAKNQEQVQGEQEAAPAPVKGGRRK